MLDQGGVMHARLISGLLAGLLPAASALCQEVPDTTVRITVNLVQVDAVVTDSHGHQMTGLEARDFEILQDAKPQKITHFAYIPTLPTQLATLSAAVADKEVLPTTVLRPSQVKR